MYRLLLVDDEPTVRRGMLSRIDWKKYEIEVVGEAANGALALEKALALKPHMILTDIKMPVMDGIELVRSVREKLPECKVIVLSGYDEFTYAKSLMSMKVSEYLLKPVDDGELMASVQRIITEIKAEQAHKADRSTANQLFNEHMPQLKQNFMQKVLSGAFSDTQEMVKQASALELKIDVNRCDFLVILIALDAVPEGENTDTLRFSVVNIAEEIINAASAGILSHMASDTFTGLLCREKGLPLDTAELGQNIRFSLKKYLDVAANVAIGQAVPDIADITISYEDARAAADERRHKGKRNYVQIVLRYVEEHYNQDLSLADAAEIAFVSPNYLSRIFKEEMKQNFIDWLNQFRVEKAKELLLQTNYKTYEIAEKVGYKDYKYFSSIFKKNTGYSPRDYRHSPPSKR